MRRICSFDESWFSWKRNPFLWVNVAIRMMERGVRRLSSFSYVETISHMTDLTFIFRGTYPPRRPSVGIRRRKPYKAHLLLHVRHLLPRVRDELLPRRQLGAVRPDLELHARRTPVQEAWISGTVRGPDGVVKDKQRGTEDPDNQQRQWHEVWDKVEGSRGGFGWWTGGRMSVRPGPTRKVVHSIHQLNKYL